MFFREALWMIAGIFLCGCSSTQSSRGSFPEKSQIVYEINTPVVRTQNGPITGVVRNDQNIFLGIPYAEAPIGKLRFLPPQPLRSWSSVRQAKTFGSAPLQNGIQLSGKSGEFYSGAPISEDCLYLNVWAPKTPGPHPVFVWVYGGANISGATNDPAYDGSSFSRSGIVFVSLNYRVGAMGFLELGNLLGPKYADSANNGLRDITQGLQWVHDNITAFGGDPAHVTIGGHSAGAKNISALLAVPAAQGLFHQAIIDSGGALTVSSLKEAAHVSQAFLAAAQISSNNSGQLLSSSTDELLRAQNSLIQLYPEHFPFRPVFGGAFLPERPLDVIRSGKARSIPLLIATCRDESSAFFPPHKSFNIREADVANMDLETLLQAQKIYIQEFPDWDNYTQAMRLLSAEEYWIPSVRMAELQSLAGGAVWMYRFDHLAKSGWLRGYAGHGSDIDAAFQHADEQTNENHVHALWVSFIKNGKPKADDIPPWPAYSVAHRFTELVNEKSTLEEDPNALERKIWNNLL
jgi:para-nitrobenzyl esterase